MHCFLPFLAVAALSLCVRSVLGADCDQMRIRCDPLFPDDREDLPWPMSEADIHATQQAEQEHCRAANESVVCLKDFEDHCENTKAMEIYREEGYFFKAQMWSADAMSCQLSINPIRYQNAIAYCDSKRNNFFNDLLVVRSAYARSSPDRAAAKRNVCESLQLTATKLDGTAKEELTTKCGKEAVNVIKDAAVKLHAAFCPA
ncbi:uncharacterized protein LOC129599028 [Paramacrobiotus metropolitanus]|uniref:uncharacterized protein LOC129599028 n=1 Tax=Paramacrobiotus metropolitanus TaxID=2943436 RepID=UPI00244632AC|nr:uncharacterized protein LOC129599028 [Paramacrobiotus metropolitanus]